MSRSAAFRPRSKPQEGVLAIRRGEDTLKLGVNYQDFIRLRSPASASQRGSDGPSSQEQRLEVAVLAAARAKSFAVRLAQRPDRQGQKHLLAQHILKQKTVSLIITDFGLRRCNGAFRGLGVGANGAEDEVEVGLPGES